MSDSLQDALEICLAAMRSGAELEVCLRMFPLLEDELRPFLRAAQLAERLGQEEVPPTALARSRARMLQRAAQLRARRRPLSLQALLPRVAFAALAVLFAVGLGAGALAAGASQALPGDALYPVKRAEESISIRLAPGSARELEADQNLSRLNEVRELLQLGREEEVSFDGRLAVLSPDRWIVGEIPVSLETDTTVSGGPEPGQIVSVEGRTHAGGWVQAASVRLRAFTYIGKVDELGAQEWTLDGKLFAIQPSTLISAGIQPGDGVVVLVRIENDGTWTAQAILHLPEEALAPGPTSTEEAGVAVDFTGAVEAMSGESWIVAGKTVVVAAGAEVEGGIHVGDVVRVRGFLTTDGSVLAERIELESSGSGSGGQGGEGNSGEGSGNGGSGGGSGSGSGSGSGGEGEGEPHGQKVEFTGVVESIGGSAWVIGGQQVSVNSNTEIEGNPKIGDTVKVVALRQSDGSLLAQKIEREDD